VNQLRHRTSINFWLILLVFEVQRVWWHLNLLRPQVRRLTGPRLVVPAVGTWLVNVGACFWLHRVLLLASPLLQLGSVLLRNVVQLLIVTVLLPEWLGNERRCHWHSLNLIRVVNYAGIFMRVAWIDYHKVIVLVHGADWTESFLYIVGFASELALPDLSGGPYMSFLRVL